MGLPMCHLMKGKKGEGGVGWGVGTTRINQANKICYLYSYPTFVSKNSNDKLKYCLAKALNTTNIPCATNRTDTKNTFSHLYCQIMGSVHNFTGTTFAC